MDSCSGLFNYDHYHTFIRFVCVERDIMSFIQARTLDKFRMSLVTYHLKLHTIVDGGLLESSVCNWVCEERHFDLCLVWEQWERWLESLLLHNIWDVTYFWSYGLLKSSIYKDLVCGKRRWSGLTRSQHLIWIWYVKGWYLESGSRTGSISKYWTDFLWLVNLFANQSENLDFIGLSEWSLN